MQNSIDISRPGHTSAHADTTAPATTEKPSSVLTIPTLHAVLKTGQIRAVNAVRTLRFAVRVKRERDALASLSAEQLRDIGVHPSHAAKESSRALYDLPRSRDRDC